MAPQIKSNSPETLRNPDLIWKSFLIIMFLNFFKAEILAVAAEPKALARFPSRIWITAHDYEGI